MSEFSVLFKKAVGCKLFDVLEWLSKKKKETWVSDHRSWSLNFFSVKTWTELFYYVPPWTDTNQSQNVTQKETDAAGVETPREAEQTGDNNTQNEGEGVGMRTTTRQPPSVVNPPSFPNLDSQKSPSEQIQTETLNKTATNNPSQTGSSLRLGEILTTRTPLSIRLL